MTSQQNGSRLPPNLRREWLWASSCHGDDDDAFTLMSYNILADCHFTDDWYPYCPQGFRKMSERHQAMMLEIRHHDPDIICLQEVGHDYFAKQLNQEMFSFGYHGIYFNKVRGIMEGEATFYKKNRFQMVEEKGVVFNELAAKECQKARLSYEVLESVLSYIDQSHLILLTKLQDVKTRKTVSIGNTHLLFDGYKNIDIITFQAGLAINALVEFSGGPNHAHILCGDFNQEPNMMGYRLMHDGKLDVDGEEFTRQYSFNAGGQCKSLFDILPQCFRHTSTGLESAYKSISGQEVPFSSMEDYQGKDWSGKIEIPAQNTEPLPPNCPRKAYYTDPTKYGDSKYIATLDYQWFDTGNLSCDGVLEMIDEREIYPFYACPNEYFPSDHLSLVGKYRFK